MIICRTPLRISFFGGGTDYPVWYREHGGKVLSTSINKYNFITLRYLPPFFDYKYRIRYYKREEVNCLDDIKHPAIRECLRYMGIERGIDIVHHGDLPAMSGLGSSSSFTVGMLHSLHALTHSMPTKRELAVKAIHIEQNILHEQVGSQDQTAAAFGGLNLIHFGGQQEVLVEPVILSASRLADLQKHLLLFFTGLQRQASEIAAEQVKATPKKATELWRMSEIVDESVRILVNVDQPITELGRLLDEQWQVKKQLSHLISTNTIDQIYETGIKAGAAGGKLLGAGGGGFMLFIAEPERHAAIREALGHLLCVPFRFDTQGSQIVYYAPFDDELA